MKTKRDSSHFWMNVATFEQFEKAQELERYLEKAGFEARTLDERTLQRYWFLAAQRCGVHVQVPTELLEKTREFLTTNRAAADFMEGAVRCPSCFSSRVQYPQMTRKFILPTLVAQVLVLLRIMDRECYCEDCHYTWPKPSGARQPQSAVRSATP